MPSTDFDLTLAMECADVFCGVTGLGCSVSTAEGHFVYERGLSSTSCRMCTLAGADGGVCSKTKLYSLGEAARFGGKYIYFCPLGFTCFTSPIITMGETVAQMTVGPFLMVDRQDYIDIDLMEIRRPPPEILPTLLDYLQNIPQLPPEKVESLASMLFMMVAFLNDVSEANKLMERRQSGEIQQNIADYIHQLKGLNEAPPYPFDTENRLLEALAKADRPSAQKHLNELFGYIFFATGNDLNTTKSRVYELLVLISRTAIKNGAAPELCLRLTHEYLQVIPHLASLDSLAAWLSSVLNEFMNHLFEFVSIKHANVIHSAIQYMQTHFEEKITLEQMAQRVFLSPTYFSRVFKQEIGQPFSVFLNSLRIKKSKELLLDTDLKLIDIALAVGFEDQSYFTKLFKRETGITPLKFRTQKGNKRP